MEKLRKMYSNFDDRHSVYPGITGLAQIEYGYVGSLIDYKNKLDYDLLYVKNLNLLTDVKIFIQTFKVVLFGNGSR